VKQVFIVLSLGNPKHTFKQWCGINELAQNQEQGSRVDFCCGSDGSLWHVARK